MRDGGDEVEAAYRRLADEPAAGEAFVKAVLAARVAIVPQQYRRLETATDALIDEALRMVAGDSTYDPAKRSLVAFLRMVVRRRVANHIRGERRRRRHEAKAARRENNPWLVAKDEPPGNGLMEAEFEAVCLDAAGAVLGEGDVRFLKAVRRGEPPEQLAVVLGGSSAEAKVLVRRAVDRITKKLRRKGIIA